MLDERTWKGLKILISTFGCASTASIILSSPLRKLSSINNLTLTPRSAARSSLSMSSEPTASCFQMKYCASMDVVAVSSIASRQRNASGPTSWISNQESSLLPGRLSSRGAHATPGVSGVKANDSDCGSGLSGVAQPTSNIALSTANSSDDNHL